MELVTGHAAFAYLAQRYGLSQEGIAGISPDAEPDAATLRDLAAHIEEHGVKTVYSETLVSPPSPRPSPARPGPPCRSSTPSRGSPTLGGHGLPWRDAQQPATLEKGQQCA